MAHQVETGLFAELSLRGQWPDMRGLWLVSSSLAQGHCSDPGDMNAGLNLSYHEHDGAAVHNVLQPAWCAMKSCFESVPRCAAIPVRA